MNEVRPIAPTQSRGCQLPHLCRHLCLAVVAKSLLWPTTLLRSGGAMDTMLLLQFREQQQQQSIRNANESSVTTTPPRVKR